MTKNFLDLASAGILLLMIVFALTFLVALLRKNRADRVQYIHSFKNGKVAVIYLCSIPLFWLGYMCDGCLPAEATWGNFHVIDSLFCAIQTSIELVVLKYPIAPISDAMKMSSLYHIVVYVCYVLVSFNAIFFVFSIISQYMWHNFRSFRFKCSNKSKLFIFGNTASSHTIYESDTTREKVIIDKISGEEQSDLYMQNILYKDTKNLLSIIDKIVTKSINGKTENVVVINTDTDIKNIEICNHFNRTIAALTPEKQTQCFNRLKIFTFGDPQNESIYEDIVTNGHGCITYVNSHQRVAIDIVEQHPFSLHLTEQHLNYSTACVREGVDINALLVGFGKTNQQFFLTSVANNQFIVKVGDKVELKRVKYHLFDCDAIASSKKLNHNYSRYENEILNNVGKGVKAEDYLPLPSQPAETTFHNLNINATEFYNEVRSVVVANPLSANFVVISFGTDLENIDMAKKLSCKFVEWDVPHYKIFVKVRQLNNEIALQNEPNCFAVGNEDKKVYNIDSIVTDRLTKMAQMRDALHEIQSVVIKKQTVSQKDIDEISAAAIKKWYFALSHLQRESSLYCCLSLRSKLNLIGFDYAPMDKHCEEVKESDYLNVYAVKDELTFYEVDGVPLTAQGKPIIQYPSQFIDSLRRNFAIHEHLRWNSFMISKGMIPSTKEQILTEVDTDGKYTNGKNYALRRHGNLTTFDGLVDFRKMVAERDGVPEVNKDVIKYDYQLMDEAYWFLAQNGYKIVKK